MSHRLQPAEAAALLGRDPVFGPLVEDVGPVRLREPFDTHFAALVRAIVYQQLAGAAAATIHRRFVAALDCDVTPAAVLAAGDDTLRDAGLSANKLAAIRDLAARVVEGVLPLDHLDALTDEEVKARLVTVRGVGPWTADMFLIFQLHRPDVWPTGDLGVRAGWARLHGLTEPPTPRQLEPLGEPYRPWRSAAAWYCWRAVDTITPDGG
jgi:DNA-3-methyladenine glycosylase II